jgi:hypothetical protein
MLSVPDTASIARWVVQLKIAGGEANKFAVQAAYFSGNLKNKHLHGVCYGCCKS